MKILLALLLFMSPCAFSMTELTDANFVEETKTMTGVVYYYADWCPYCTKMTPILEKLEKENPNLKFTKVNIDTAGIISEIAETVPKLAFYKNGQFRAYFNGYAREQNIKEIFEVVFAAP